MLLSVTRFSSLFALFLLLLLVSLSAVAQGGATEPAETPAESDEGPAGAPFELEKHHLVLLMRPDDPAELAPEEAREVQKAHLGHLTKVWEEGYALIAGPFEVPDDEKMRGLVLYRGDLDVEEVRDLAEADPAVKAGRLEVKVLPWWHREGMMHFEPPPEEAPGS